MKKRIILLLVVIIVVVMGVVFYVIKDKGYEKVVDVLVNMESGDKLFVLIMNIDLQMKYYENDKVIYEEKLISYLVFVLD